MISAIGKKIELYKMFFNQALLCFWLISLNFSNSIASLLKSCTIFIPVNRSWTKVFRLEISFRTSLKAPFIFFLNILVATNIIGIMEIMISDSFQFKKNMKPKTTTIFSKSLAILNKPWLKILAIDSMSDTVRVTNFPTGSSSKYFILKEAICWNNFKRISLIMSCPNQFAQ